MSLLFLSQIILIIVCCDNFLDVSGWEPEQQPRLVFRYQQAGTGAEFRGENNRGNGLSPKQLEEYFTVLRIEGDSVLIGARNTVYNISLPDLKEDLDQRITWPSSDAHQELCLLKGKSELDCQNYIRIAAKDTGSNNNSTLLVCGTNSFKPLCRRYSLTSDVSDTSDVIDDVTSRDRASLMYYEEYEGTGVCPFDPRHNSTAVYTDGQLFSGTVADFSGGDPLVYRSPQRTERYDLGQLNNPQFTGSLAVTAGGGGGGGDAGGGRHVMLFFRETAVEHMNCGKVVYSRVGRVCNSDRGGPRHFQSRWTSYVKARLNCSVPGEYPFHFDEIQSISDQIDGTYGSQGHRILYAVFTTAPSAIGGSAICAFSVDTINDILDHSPFKGQPGGINGNWLSVQPPADWPRPGSCVPDSRTLSEQAVNFARAHSLVDKAVPAFYGRPVITRVSLQYRFTTIAVDAQVRAMNGRSYDVLYVGTDDGRVIKCLNVRSADSVNGTVPVVVSETQVVQTGEPVRQLRVVKSQSGGGDRGDRLLVVTGRRVLAAELYKCRVGSCRDCLQLQDPHCAFDKRTQLCTALSQHPYPSAERFLQDVTRGDPAQCQEAQVWPGRSTVTQREHDGNKQQVKPIIGTRISLGDDDTSADRGSGGLSQDSAHGRVTDNNIGGGDDDNTRDNEIVIELVGSDALAVDGARTGPVMESASTYSAQTMHTVIAISCLATLAFGFIFGFIFSSRRMRQHGGSYTEQHSHRHLESNFSSGNNSAQCSQYVTTPPNNKNSNNSIPASNINLLLKNNTTSPASIGKQDNLQLAKQHSEDSCLKNSTENLDNMGTLQKVKKTYI